jgi:hypothetical protein
MKRAVFVNKCSAILKISAPPQRTATQQTKSIYLGCTTEQLRNLRLTRTNQKRGENKYFNIYLQTDHEMR